MVTRALEESFAPYAPARAVLAVIERGRQRGLPDPLTPDTLATVGVQSTMTQPTHRALRFLQLIDEQGKHLEALERLRKANTAEYQETLGEIIRAAYIKVFEIVNPAEDGDIAIADAFRRFEPANQREKMIRLFRGLCEAAGLMQPTTGTRHPSQSAARQPRSPGSRRTNPIQRTPATRGRDSSREGMQDNADFRLIFALIQQMPQDRRWTADKRQRWLKAMESAVDLLVSLVPDEALPAPPQDR